MVHDSGDTDVKYIVVRTTIDVQEVEADDYGSAVDESEHYPFPSQWETKMSYMVTEK